jgi:hypothetical protein
MSNLRDAASAAITARLRQRTQCTNAARRSVMFVEICLACGILVARESLRMLPLEVVHEVFVASVWPLIATRNLARELFVLVQGSPMST